MSKKINFIECDTKKGLVAMIIPMVVVMILDLAYNLIDGLWVGNMLGGVDYAALTNSTPVLLLLVAVSLGGTNGISILVSQAIGLKDKAKTKSVIATSFIISIAIPIVVIILLEVFLKSILTLINVPSETYNLAYKYIAIYILGYLPIYLYLFFSAVLRSFGDMNFLLIPMISSIILNIILDPLFIKLMGFKGVAVATVIAQTVAMIIVVVYILKKKVFSLSLKGANIGDMKNLIKKSIPSIIQQSLPSISTIFLTAFISGFGIVALDAYGVISGVERFLLYPAMSLNMVLTVIAGQCFGGGRKDRAKDYLRVAIKYGSVVLIILASIIIIFSKDISRLFINENQVAKIVFVYFLIMAVGYICNFITNGFLGTLNGMGEPSKGMMIMLFYYLAVRVPLAYFLSEKTNLGLTGIWIAILVSNLIASVISSLYTRIRLKS